MFDDNGLPQHVDRINSETANMFSSLRGQRESMARALGIPFEKIDMKIAWRVFDGVAFNTIFKECGGDQEALYDPYVRARVMTATMQKWAILYFLEVCQQRGTLATVETQGSTIYFVPDRHKPSIKTLLTASSTPARR